MPICFDLLHLCRKVKVEVLNFLKCITCLSCLILIYNWTMLIVCHVYLISYLLKLISWMHLLVLALIIDKVCLIITIGQRLLVLLMLGWNHYPSLETNLSRLLKWRCGQSMIRISLLRLKLLLPLLKEKSLIHLDPIKLGTKELLIHLWMQSIQHVNRLIWNSWYFYSRHMIEESTLLSNVI